jgi:hypothetical protein
MTPNGQSRSQKLRPHMHGTTTTRKGNQPLNYFNAVIIFMLAMWPDYLFNAAPHLPPPGRTVERKHGI